MSIYLAKQLYARSKGIVIKHQTTGDTNSKQTENNCGLPKVNLDLVHIQYNIFNDVVTLSNLTCL